MQRSALCRSRRELSNEYLLAKIGVDTAENEPCKVCPLSAYRSPRFECVTIPSLRKLYKQMGNGNSNAEGNFECATLRKLYKQMGNGK